MSTFPARSLVVALVVAICTPRAARAAVVIESYEAERPAEASEIMAVLLAELAATGAWATPSLVKTALVHRPRSAISEPSITGAALTDDMELGVKSYLHAEFGNATVQLGAALARVHANPGVVVGNDKTKSAVLRALVALALSHAKLGDPTRSVEAMTDYVRSTREPVTRNMFGPAGEQLYNEVRKALDPVKRGNLVVNVTEPDAQIFVNELGTGRGSTYAADLLPGSYRVVVQVGRTARRYDAIVRPDAAMSLEIDWAFDTALDVSDDWVGFAHANAGAVSENVRRLSRRMGNERTLIVLGLRRERDHVAVIGSHYDDATTGHVERSGEVRVNGPGDRGPLRALARFLANGERSPEVRALGGGPVERLAPGRAPVYVFGTVALAALALGGYWLYVDGKPCGTTACEPRKRAELSLGSGAILGAFAVIWTLRTRAATRARTSIGVRSTRGGGIVAVGWRF